MLGKAESLRQEATDRLFDFQGLLHSCFPPHPGFGVCSCVQAGLPCAHGFVSILVVTVSWSDLGQACPAP